MTCSIFADADTNLMIEKIRAEHGLPALGGIVIVDGEVKAVGVAGMRKYKGKEEVTADDKWHIGSCTKSMTATLAATFVEEGKLKWESTLSDVFGRSVRMRDEYEGVTLLTLLNNRSGIPGNGSVATKLKARAGDGKRDIAKRRQKYVESLLGLKPEFAPGSKYGYSNGGFVVAGAMLEKVSGKSWEELMQERIFDPLKMTSAGFGGAATKRKEDQPWGHASKTKPVKPGPGDDNPDVISPAGRVHCSLPDLARYVQMHATHEIGPVLKKAETFEFLQTVGKGNDDYACGWVVMDRPWAKGPALYHNGTNTMNYCVIWMAPARKFGVIAVTNVGDANAPCDAVVSGLMGEYLTAGGVADIKVSPFSGVRWNGDMPVVKVGEEWVELVSLDGISAVDIVAFSKKTHGGNWQMRFSEDLVELMAAMGHQLKRTVKLVVKVPDSSVERTLESVKMTRANREVIRAERMGE